MYSVHVAYIQQHLELYVLILNRERTYNSIWNCVYCTSKVHIHQHLELCVLYRKRTAYNSIRNCVFLHYTGSVHTTLFWTVCTKNVQIVYIQHYSELCKLYIVQVVYGKDCGDDLCLESADDSFYFLQTFPQSRFLNLFRLFLLIHIVLQIHIVFLVLLLLLVLL